MSNSGLPRSLTNPLRRKPTPGEAEFLAMFQLLTAPALLADRQHEQVIAANSAFLQLTAYAKNEVAGKPVRDLLEDLPAHPLSAEDTLSASLNRRSRSPVPVNLHVRSLEGSDQWMVLVLDPQEERRSLVARMEQVVAALGSLNSPSADETVRQSLERSAAVIRELFHVSSVAIYRINDAPGHGQNPAEPGSVWKAAEIGEAGSMPDTLSAADLVRLGQTFIWKPGRRVQTELHRFARVQNFSYLASTPINHNGLLVIADRGEEPSEYLQLVLEACGRQISAMLKTQLQMMDLRRLALENRRELSVWRSVGDNAQEGLLLLAPDLTVSEMNQAAEWMLGYVDWEVKGQPAESILIGPERLAPALEIAVQGIPTHNMGNVSLHRRNGVSFPAHIQIIPVQREGETLAIVISFSDVSEHVEIRNRTQQLEQRAVLGEVTAVFAHEVRNPINNISTGLQLLSVKLPEEDPNQENITRLLNDCTRLNHLMEGVLNFSRQAEHKFESVNLEFLLGRLLDRWRPRMAKVSVTPFFHVAENTPPVLADPRSLEQVFTNLVSNAVEAMTEKGGTLAVRVAPFHLLPGKPQVEITVSDSGPGIPDEVRERMFEPFVTTKASGTGLGLAITKRIVTAHHGSISVNSFPGGTVFHVLLSAYQGESE